MKKLILAAALVACFGLSRAKAQNVNGVKLTDIHVDYIQIRAEKSFFEDKQWILLEYGQKVDEYSEMYIRDDNAKKLEFNSAIDAVNKMKSYDYELFSVYTEQVSSDSNRPVYVLKRK
ncbi:hypothetical protein EZ456_08435 [Pedobacter psychrodurus]|uniref:Uncharacterized protein n=1 Tax=Pedobacter psychrodurus TaxID=2530456 RepID=A0A4R0PYA0_9SPHI|nr:hypothetical protein [Pedobacter psychrodurus]TCD27962.1 hypothetical protein EZ456_08435 [Pedobacter psychrodurus]